MSLIKLEDVLHRIYSEPNTSDKLYQDINSLPQYNPEYGWIPVTERLPELGERVLCFEDGFQYVASASEGGFYKHTNSTYVVYPTFWMPLPLPPKQ